MNHFHHLFDLKVNFVLGLFFTISFSNVEVGMKILAFLLTVGYTARRWYLLEKNKDKKENE